MEALLIEPEQIATPATPHTRAIEEDLPLPRTRKELVNTLGALTSQRLIIFRQSLSNDPEGNRIFDAIRHCERKLLAVAYTGHQDDQIADDVQDNVRALAELLNVRVC